MGGVYKLLFENGYYYIGSSNCLQRRKNDHLKSLSNNVHYNPFLQKIYNKYKDYEFIILYSGKDYLKEEQELLDFHFNNEFNMNLRSSVNDLNNVKENYWAKVKETTHKPIVQIDPFGNILAIVLNIFGTTKSGFNVGNIGKCLTKKGATYRGCSFHYLELFPNLYEKNYNVYLKDTFSDVNYNIKKSVIQKDMSGRVVNVYRTLRDVQVLGRFYRKKVSEAIKSKKKHSDYYWEYTNYQESLFDSQYCSDYTMNNSGIIVESINGKYKKEFESITKAVAELGFDKSVRTKFSRVANGIRNSTRGYIIKYKNQTQCL